jgi:hypothetical protein
MTTDNLIARHEKNVVQKVGVRFWCLDCGGSADEGYMVKREIWELAIPDYGELKKRLWGKYGKRSDRAKVLLCLPCLSERLDRPVLLQDLTACRLNGAYFEGAAMMLYQIEGSVDTLTSDPSARRFLKSTMRKMLTEVKRLRFDL